MVDQARGAIERKIELSCKRAHEEVAAGSLEARRCIEDLYRSVLVKTERGFSEKCTS